MDQLENFVSPLLPLYAAAHVWACAAGARDAWIPPLLSDTVRIAYGWAPYRPDPGCARLAAWAETPIGPEQAAALEALHSQARHELFTLEQQQQLLADALDVAARYADAQSDLRAQAGGWDLPRCAKPTWGECGELRWDTSASVVLYLATPLAMHDAGVDHASPWRVEVIGHRFRADAARYGLATVLAAALGKVAR